MRNMAFIYLPFVSPMMPPLGISMIKAFLEDNGINSQLYDLNVELYRFLLEKNNVKDGLEYLNNLVNDNCYNLNEKDDIKKLDYMIKGEYILENIDKVGRQLSLKGDIRSYKDLYITSQIISTALGMSTSKLAYLDNTNPTFLAFNKEFSEYNTIFNHESWEKIKKWVYKRIDDICENNEYISFSICYDNQIYFLLFIAQYIKSRFKEKKIIVGGPAISAIIKDMAINFEQKFLNQYAHLVDYAIMGDGEYPLLDIIRDKENKNVFKSPFNNMKIDNGIDKTPPLVIPNFDGLPLEMYFTSQLVLPMITSRHCYWGKCKFCTHSVGYNRYIKYNSKDIISCLSKLKEKYNVTKFYFVDECMPPIVAYDISKWIRTTKNDITWMTDMRFEKQLEDDKFVKELYEGGCRYIAFGMESANNRVLGVMSKGTNKERIQKIIDNLSVNNIYVTLMFFFGFPTETVEEALETFDFVMGNSDKISGVGMGSFKLMPGSYVYYNYKKYGITSINKYNYENSIGMNEKEAEMLYKRCLSIIEKKYFRGHPLYHRIYYLLQLSVDDEKEYPIGLTLLENLYTTKKILNDQSDLKINKNVIFKNVNIVENGEKLENIIAFVNLSSLRGGIYYINRDIYNEIFSFTKKEKYELKQEVKEELFELGVLIDE